MLKNTAEADAFLREVETKYGPKVRGGVQRLLDNRVNPVFIPDVVLQEVLVVQDHQAVRTLNASLSIRFNT
jgi:hypothetical protein